MIQENVGTVAVTSIAWQKQSQVKQQHNNV
jgi:hypothetical protein